MLVASAPAEACTMTARAKQSNPPEVAGESTPSHIMKAVPIRTTASSAFCIGLLRSSRLRLPGSGPSAGPAELPSLASSSCTLRKALILAWRHSKEYIANVPPAVRAGRSYCLRRKAWVLAQLPRCRQHCIWPTDLLQNRGLPLIPLLSALTLGDPRSILRISDPSM